MDTEQNNDSFFGPSFFEKVLEAMDEEERNKLSPERTEQMLRKIRFAASLDRAAMRHKKRLKNKPIIFEKQKLNMIDQKQEVK